MKMKMKNLAVVLGTLTLSACASQSKLITQDEMRAKAEIELQDMYSYKPAKNMQLYDAVAVVLMRNQDLYTKNFELQIAKGKKLAATLDYLPELTYEQRGLNRDRLLLSTSSRFGGNPIENVDTTPSYSSNLNTRTDSLRLSWDVLNVFKNYLTSKQVGNGEIIAMMNRERVAQHTFRDVLPAYYLVNLKQNEGEQLLGLSGKLKSSLDGLCSSMANKGQVVHDTLITNCDSALSSHSSVQDLIFQLSEAEHNLKAMMSVSSSTPFHLGKVDYSDPGEMKLKVDQLIDIALANRPELFIEQYNKKNAELEKKKSWLDILPSIELSVAQRESDNSFLVNKEWEEDSVNITWNIITKLIKAPLNARQASRRVQLANSRYRALLITTITQVQIAYEAYNKDRLKWINSHQRAVVADRANDKSQKKYEAGQTAQIVFLGQEIDSIQRGVQSKADYVRMIDSLSMLYLSLGIPVTPLIDGSDNAQQLAQRIERQLRALSII